MPDIVHQARRGPGEITLYKYLWLWKAKGYVDVRVLGSFSSNRFIEGIGGNKGYWQPVIWRTAWSFSANKAKKRCLRYLCSEIEADKKSEIKEADKRVFVKQHTFTFENPCE